MKKIANQGMNSMETHHTGDLIILFDVEFPPIDFFKDLQVRIPLSLFLQSNVFLPVEIGKYFTQ